MNLEHALFHSDSLVLRQHADPAYSTIQPANRYDVGDGQRAIFGTIQEDASADLAQSLTNLFSGKVNRVLWAFDASGTHFLSFSRQGSWTRISTAVYAANGTHLGVVSNTSQLMNVSYDLHDMDDSVFARVSSQGFFDPTYSIQPTRPGHPATVKQIVEDWMREQHTRADTFRLDFGPTVWTKAQRAVILATALSIDLDFYEYEPKRED